MVYSGSHLLFDNIYRSSTESKSFHFVDPEILAKIPKTRVSVKVKAGDLVLWDSRTFHQNSYGSRGNKEERLVQYVSFLPKWGKGNTVAQQNKRLKYFKDRRTTSHWAYPLRVNSKQPQTYGNKSKLINYSALPAVDLDDLMPRIKKVL